MKVHLPDSVIRHMAKSGMGTSEAGTVVMAVTMPESVTPLDNGLTRYDGFGATVIGKIDSTGKHLTVNIVKVDTRP